MLTKLLSHQSHVDDDAVDEGEKVGFQIKEERMNVNIIHEHEGVMKFPSETSHPKCYFFSPRRWHRE
jgi:hypothetical protein